MFMLTKTGRSNNPHCGR